MLGGAAALAAGACACLAATPSPLADACERVLRGVVALGAAVGVAETVAPLLVQAWFGVRAHGKIFGALMLVVCGAQLALVNGLAQGFVDASGGEIGANDDAPMMVRVRRVGWVPVLAIESALCGLVGVPLSLELHRRHHALDLGAEKDGGSKPSVSRRGDSGAANDDDEEEQRAALLRSEGGGGGE